MNFNKDILQHCNYSNTVCKKTEMFIKQILPDFLKYKYSLLYFSSFWFISKFLEDELISLDDYVYLTQSNKESILDCESEIFNYYLNHYHSLNALIFDASGTLDDSSGFETSINGGVGAPDTFLKDPPGVSTPV